jgi:predicted RNA-binding protein associated with RNAse of E/G family
MQSPLTRTHLNFDHWDHQLDILVKPDRSWSWKDEDELQLVVQLNRMSAQQAKAVREEGQRAVQQIQQNGVPFSDGWEDWQADSTWSLPELGSKWGDLSMYRQSSPQQGQGE